MIKALLLMFAPTRTWEPIFRAQRTLGVILGTYLLPLLLLSSLAEGYGMAHWGKWRGEVRYVKKFSTGEVVIFETVQVVASVLLVLIGARLVKMVGETFHGRHKYAQAFTAVAYGLGPLFLFRMLDAFRPVAPWMSWAIGILFSIGVLYSGLPTILQPDPPHAFGLFVMSSFLLFFTTGLFEIVKSCYVLGKFPQLEARVADLAARLPF